MKKCTTYKPGQRYCDLCITEKLLIIQNAKNPKAFNKKARHNKQMYTHDTV